MKNTNYSAYKPKASILEIRESDLLNRNRRKNYKYFYPRHIVQLESPSHQGYGNGFNNLYSLPTSCALNTVKKTQTANMAVEILKYQLSDRAAKQAHFNSVRRSLERRLKAAKSNGNEHLINLLKKEYLDLQLT